MLSKPVSLKNGKKKFLKTKTRPMLFALKASYYAELLL